LRTYDNFRLEQDADIPATYVTLPLHEMADPLSITASVIALVDFSAKVGGGLYKVIKRLKHAPDILEDLSKETNSLQAVLDDLEKRVLPPPETQPDGQGSEEGLLNIPTEDESLLRTELRKAQEILDQLDALVEKMLSRNVTKKRVEWLLKEEQVGDLKCRLTEANARIQALLGASS
jgi:hypothetical protein